MGGSDRPFDAQSTGFFLHQMMSSCLAGTRAENYTWPLSSKCVIESFGIILQQLLLLLPLLLPPPISTTATLSLSKKR